MSYELIMTLGQDIFLVMDPCDFKNNLATWSVGHKPQESTKYWALGFCKIEHYKDCTSDLKRVTKTY